MKQETKQKLYFGGVSTDIEVKALMDHFGVPTPGTVLAYEDIEVVVGVERGKSRFTTVRQRYMQQMMKLHGVHLKALPNVGLKALTAQERVDTSIDRAVVGMRRLRESEERLRQVPRTDLAKPDAARADAAQVLLAKLCGEFSSEKKTFQAPGAASTAPRLAVVNGN